MAETKIGFYSSRGKYGCFCNFSRHPITLKGKVWPTTEHFYQAQKFAGTHHEEAIRLSRGPGDAAKLGNSRELPLREDWNQVKEGMMMEALRAKFSQHDKCRQTLLETGDAYLFEDSQIDYYWGVGKSGTGKNRLGFLLMKLRYELSQR
jgi:N-glycosidase YbiA